MPGHLALFVDQRPFELILKNAILLFLIVNLPLQETDLAQLQLARLIALTHRLCTALDTKQFFVHS